MTRIQVNQLSRTNKLITIFFFEILGNNFSDNKVRRKYHLKNNKKADDVSAASASGSSLSGSSLVSGTSSNRRNDKPQVGSIPSDVNSAPKAPAFEYFDYPFIGEDGTLKHNLTSSLIKNNDYIGATTSSPTPSGRRSSKRKHKIINPSSNSPASRPQPVYQIPEPFSPATKCSPSKCYLPDCFCGGTTIPGGLTTKQTPQVILLTFDDSVNDLNWEIYEEIFTGRRNPNGCPILGTFYVSHEWTDYGQVQTLYSRGHEMASHSIT